MPKKSYSRLLCTLQIWTFTRSLCKKLLMIKSVKMFCFTPVVGIIMTCITFFLYEFSGNEENELGIVNGNVADSQFTESSCGTDNCGSTARIDSLTSTDCWMPVNSTTSEWLEVNLTDSVTLMGMAIQGRSPWWLLCDLVLPAVCWDETSAFQYYQDEYGSPKVCFESLQVALL